MGFGEKVNSKANWSEKIDHPPDDNFIGTLLSYTFLIDENDILSAFALSCYYLKKLIVKIWSGDDDEEEKVINDSYLGVFSIEWSTFWGSKPKSLNKKIIWKSYYGGNLIDNYPYC